VSLPDFSSAFVKVYPLVYQVAYRLLGSRGDAEDVAQDVLARGLREHPRFCARTFEAYRDFLWKLCKRRCLERLRRAGRAGPADGGDEWRALVVALLREGYDYERVAEILGKPIRWVAAAARAGRRPRVGAIGTEEGADPGQRGAVTAPSAADDTSEAYLAKTPAA
jgi:DNA-directed RNA polymerase specialized sigma24 family protein